MIASGIRPLSLLNQSRWTSEELLLKMTTASSTNLTLDSLLSNGRIRHPYTSVTMIFTAIPVGVIIFMVVFGNALVIAAVLRDSQLKRQYQNWLIVSLAAADLLVGLLIMPLTLAYELLDEWTLSGALCELWLALDVLFVTASILNLCAISLDRYWSLTDPMSYPQTRTPRRMFLMIMVVWLSAFAISFPPLVGWRPEERAVDDCVLSDQLGYVLYSAFGSFYIPVSVLLFVYARIYFISRRRKKKSPNVTVVVGVSSTKKLSLANRFRRLLARRRPTKLTQSKPITIEKPIANSREDLLNCASTATPTPSSPGPDYAAVIARVRALATIRHQSISISDIDSDRNRTSTTLATCTNSMPAGPVARDPLSHVMAIAAAAAAHSRQEHLSESLTAKAYELQTQLRQRRKLVRRRERQATVVLGFVLGSFVVSWMPFFCSYLLSAVCCKTPDLIFDLIFWLGYCNSGLNPFIYNFFNRDFRRAFRRILCDPINRRLSIHSWSNSFRQREQRRSRPKDNRIPNGVSAAGNASRSGSQKNKRPPRLGRRHSFSSLDNED